MKIIVYIIGFLLIVSISIGAWQLTRVWNYKFSYRTMVRQTVLEMVKESAIKEEYTK